MDRRWGDIVRPRLKDIEDVLEPSAFLGDLFSEELLRSDEYEKLSDLDRRRQTEQLLIVLLPRKGLECYDKFVDILSRTEGQKHVARLFLDTTEVCSSPPSSSTSPSSSSTFLDQSHDDPTPSHTATVTDSGRSTNISSERQTEPASGSQMLPSVDVSSHPTVTHTQQEEECLSMSRPETAEAFPSVPGDNSTYVADMREIVAAERHMADNIQSVNPNVSNLVGSLSISDSHQNTCTPTFPRTTSSRIQNEHLTSNQALSVNEELSLDTSGSSIIDSASSFGPREAYFLSASSSACSSSQSVALTTDRSAGHTRSEGVLKSSFVADCAPVQPNRLHTSGPKDDTEVRAMCEPYVHEDICQLDKNVVVFGGKTRPGTIEKLNLATGRCTIDENASTILRGQGGRHTSGIAVIEKEMHIIGGCCGPNQHGSALVLLYNLQTGSISIKSSLSQARSACGVGVVCGNIYAIGGCYGQKCLDSVEMCHRETNYEEWEDGPSLRSPRAGTAIAVVDERLYCLGGYDGEVTLSRVSVLKGWKWNKAPAMNEPRRDFAAVALGKCIYAIGGRNGSKPLDTVEKYDPATKKWEMVQNLPSSARYGHSAFTINNKICVVGGSNTVNSLAVYDSGGNCWDELCYRVPGKRDPVPYRFAVPNSFSGVVLFDSI